MLMASNTGIWMVFGITTTIVFSLPVHESLPAQRFAIEPVDKTAIINDTTLLACRVVNKVGTIQWTRDNFGLGTERELIGYPRYTMTGNDEEGDFSLQIRNVQLEDDARFQCQVGAADGVTGIRSRDATLTVHVPPDPPSIVDGEFLRTTAGTDVALTCESLNGKPAAELTWLDHDNNPVPAEQVTYSTQILSDGKRVNAFSKFSFKASKDHDGRRFSCRAENPAVKKPMTTSIQIAVKYPPDVKLQMDRQHVLEGEDVTFNCEASANPKHVVYKWFRDGQVVVGDYSNTYTIHSVARQDNGVTVTCEVSNSVGVAKSSLVLSLNFGPVLRSPLQQVYGATIGQEVRLKCDVAGNPTPEIIWLFEGSPRVLSTDSELVIPAMNYDSAGRYLCRASVRGFPEISTSTQVFIKGPPRVTAAPIQYGSEGESVRIECLIQSVPPPIRISWTRNAKIVDTSPGYEQVEEKLETESLIRNSLIIHVSRREDFGVYNCSAENDFGSDHVMVSLTMQKSFPMLMMVGGAITAVVLIVSLAISFILCFKKKTVDSTDSLSDLKHPDIGSKTTAGSAAVMTGTHFLSVGDAGSSGAGSDLKAEIRTSSSLSERREWVDGLPNQMVSQVTENIYNYSQQQERFYASKIDNSSPANNNSAAGYVPYTDYNREFQTQAGQQHVYPSTQPQHASLVVTADRDSYGDVYGSLSSTAALVDPHYGRVCVASQAYLRMPVVSSSIVSQMSNLPHGSVITSAGQTPSPCLSFPGHNHPHPHLHQVPPVNLTHGSSSNHVYLTTSLKSVRQTPLATHV